MRSRAGRITWVLGLALLMATTAEARESGAVVFLQPELTQQRTASYFISVRDRPSQLEAFLRAMPKGADLHTHASGAIYAESFLQYASQDALCVGQQSAALSDPPCDPEQGNVPAASAAGDSVLQNSVLDAWSMRDFAAGGAETGAQHFFATFSRFALAGRGHIGDELAEIAARAADQNEIALELMLNADGGAAARLGGGVQWDDDLASLREKLSAAGLAGVVANARRALDEAEAAKQIRLGCATPSAEAGCGVEIHYLREAHRNFAPTQVFAELLVGFELAVADPRVVGVNLVGREDATSALRDIDLHMSMLEYLHSVYPTVPITLHAGELQPRQVTPADNCCHVRLAVERGGASRVGHGVDILSEQDPVGLMSEMTQAGVLVEILLTSNAQILGVQGPQNHPLPAYLRAGVPVALATDDEGVLRTDLTHEYMRAAQEFGLSYIDLKTMARNSVTFSFLSGDSLWESGQAFVPRAECSADGPTAEPSAACGTFLASSARARAQWRLEAGFVAFESHY